MTSERDAARLAARRGQQVQVGLVLTGLWLGAGLLYVATSLGWTGFLRLPLGDLGIVVAVQRAYRLRTRPKPARLRKMGEAWRPYRSVASWYLWRSLDNEPVPPPTPTKRRKSA